MFARLFQRKKQADTFLTEENIADDFNLLNYETDKDAYKTNLVGTNTTGSHLKILKYDLKVEDRLKFGETSFNVGFSIHHVLTGFVNNTNDNIYLLIERIDNSNPPEFNIYSFDPTKENQKPFLVFNSDIMPFLILNTDHERVLIVRNNENAQIIVNTPDKKESFELRNFFVSDQYNGLTSQLISKIPAYHSSTFIDIDNDGCPDIILDIVENKKRKLLMFLTKSKQMVEYELPLETGPLLFEDFDRDGFTDMCYVENTQSDSGPSLRIVYSNLSKDNVVPFSDESKDNVITLNNIELKNAKFELKDEKTGLMKGIFSYDMKLSQFPSLIAIIRHENKLKPIILCPDIKTDNQFSFLKKKQSKQEKLSYLSNYSPNLNIENVVSVSCLDPYRTGREGLVLNYIEDGNFKLTFMENNLDVTNNKLSFLTLDNQDKTKKLKNRPLPGVSYTITADDTIMRNHSIISTSWLSLRKPLITFGLGAINTLVDDVIIKIPFKKEIPLERKLIPNSDLVLIYRDDKLEVELLLKYSFYIQAVFITLFVVLAINLLLVIGFTIVERKQERIKKRKEAVAFNFKAL
ncbi:putative membrane protein [Pseudoloma neurophilia]|uniref:Putative membrane protein n=1 Tax=Pseudoloma neurophilia TaxID=146866 RepID=A0A0R0M472_9MICR|nr:putative membrane protein [Pseudoloma neurophilia]